MQAKITLIVCVTILCMNSFGPKTSMAAFDVTKFGAKGDGQTNDANAFKQAWSAFCQDNSATSTLIVPSGKTFLVSPMRFEGPCKPSKLYLQVLGNIVAPKSIGGWSGCAVTGSNWLYFGNVNNLNIQGPGQFDGQGALWWNTHAPMPCNRPPALAFNNCNGLRLDGTKHINSPRAHITVNGCNYVDIGHLNIMSPANSPNTDGFDFAGVNHINIHDSYIGCGDDCVAISGGCSDVNITRVNCGPGHGISIGSLGKDKKYDTVSQVHVTYSNISNTQNGLRIKTMPGGSGYAKDISFEHIRLKNVQNPIIIDQHYCLPQPTCPSFPKAVAVSSVRYIDIQGSSASQVAINFDCSEVAACTGITTDQVYITGSGVTAKCNNAHGRFTATSPSVPCK